MISGYWETFNIVNLAAVITTGLEMGCRCKKGWKSVYRCNKALTVNRNNLFALLQTLKSLCSYVATLIIVWAWILENWGSISGMSRVLPSAQHANHLWDLLNLLSTVQPRVKQPRCETDHSLLSSAKVKMHGTIPPFLHVFMAQWLTKPRNNCIFIITLTHFLPSEYGPIFLFDSFNSTALLLILNKSKSSVQCNSWNMNKDGVIFLTSPEPAQQT